MAKQLGPRKYDPITFDDIVEISDSEGGEIHAIMWLVEAELHEYGSVGQEPCEKAKAFIKEWSNGDEEVEREIIWTCHDLVPPQVLL